MNNKYRELTEEEIKSLSLDLRICYYLSSWNASAEINTIEDWIDFCWVIYDYVDNNGTEKDYRKLAKNEFEKLKEFIQELQKEGRFEKRRRTSY